MMKTTLTAVILILNLAAESMGRTDSTESINCSPMYSLGNVIGGIGLINPKFIAQNIFSSYELQIMAGYGLAGKYAAEIDLNYLLYSSDKFSHSAGIGIGTRYDDTRTGKNFWGWGEVVTSDKIRSVYGKVNYSLNWHFLFLQTGIGLGNNSYYAPRFTLQLGLMYHF